MSRLEAGQSAPDFTLPAADGRQVTLSDYRGSKVIIFFYPEAMTPACTMEACDFRDSVEPLRAAGYEILGISPDDVDKLAQFAATENLSYPLLSDPDHTVLVPWATWGEKNLYGRIVTGVIRSTFVIDEAGVITTARYNVKATGHVASLRKALKI